VRIEKEKFDIFNVKSIPFLENRIAQIKKMLESRRVIDKETIAILESVLLSDEEILNHLRAEQK
jgi:hypothetical protein